MNDWKENSIKPEEEGYYLTTHLRPQMYGSCGGESYGWETDVSFFNGELWEDGGVLAWKELPYPYYTTDDEKEKELLQNAYENDTDYEKQRKYLR